MLFRLKIINTYSDKAKPASCHQLFISACYCSVHYGGQTDNDIIVIRILPFRVWRIARRRQQRTPEAAIRGETNTTLATGAERRFNPQNIRLSFFKISLLLTVAPSCLDYRSWSLLLNDGAVLTSYIFRSRVSHLFHYRILITPECLCFLHGNNVPWIYWLIFMSFERPYSIDSVPSADVLRCLPDHTLNKSQLFLEHDFYMFGSYHFVCQTVAGKSHRFSLMATSYLHSLESCRYIHNNRLYLPA